MKCPTCGRYSLEFQADQFMCTSCGEVFPPSKVLEIIEPLDGWLKGPSADDPDAKPREIRDESNRNEDIKSRVDDAMGLISDLSLVTWQFFGSAIEPSVRSVREYGARYDELDAEKGNRMRDYLGRSIREQFDLDLQTIACRLALLDDKVLPEELALINGALGLSLDEEAVRACAKSAKDAGENFFSTPPQSFVAAVVYDNLLYGETKTPMTAAPSCCCAR